MVYLLDNHASPYSFAIVVPLSLAHLIPPIDCHLHQTPLTKNRPSRLTLKKEKKRETS